MVLTSNPHLWSYFSFIKLKANTEYLEGSHIQNKVFTNCTANQLNDFYMIETLPLKGFTGISVNIYYYIAFVHSSAFKI